MRLDVLNKGFEFELIKITFKTSFCYQYDGCAGQIEVNKCGHAGK